MKKKTFVAAITGGLCLFVCVCLLVYARNANADREVPIDPSAYYKVAYVVDGDTFKAYIGKKEITVRVLGINTPETVDPRKAVECYGPEASDESKGLLSGRQVRLAFSPYKEHRDKYGRYLLYVYREDGLFLNEELLKGGFAKEYTYGKPYSLQAEFRAIESEAKSAKIGLWGLCDTTSKT